MAAEHKNKYLKGTFAWDTIFINFGLQSAYLPPPLHDNVAKHLSVFQFVRINYKRRDIIRIN